MQCPSCGRPVAAVLFRCGHCGSELPPPPGWVPIYEPTPLVPVRRMAPIDHYAQWTIAALWTAALVNVATWVVLGLHWPWRMDARLGLLGGAPTIVMVLLVLGTIAGLLSRAVLIAWLYRARSNVDVFPDAQPDWRRGWVFGSWFIPIANLFLPYMVIADVARNSADEVTGRETSSQTARVWLWWTMGKLQSLLGGFWLWIGTPWLIIGLAQYTTVNARLTMNLVSPAFGVIFAVAGAYVGSRVVGGITREQRMRVERVWVGNAAEAWAAGVIG
jgi:uncharacterized protein DUF4328